MLKTIPVVEIFNGLQGEGMFAGTPSIFIRFFGCNLRCKFGMKDYDQMEKDAYIKQVVKYEKDFPDKTLEELPVFGNYCDTYYAIHPEYRRFSKEMSVNELTNEIPFETNEGNMKTHIVFTGGEPLLPGYQDFLSDLIPKLIEKGYIDFTFETNTTYHLTDKFKNMISKIQKEEDVIFSFSMSPKMSDSCLPKSKTWVHNVANEYIDNFDCVSWFKFVVRNETEVYEVLEYLNEYVSDPGVVPVYLMPSGATKEELDKTQKIVYDLCCEFGFRYSPRLHVTVAGGGIGV